MAGIVTATTTDSAEQAQAALEHYGFEATVESTPMGPDGQEPRKPEVKVEAATPAPAAEEPEQGEETAEQGKTAGEPESSEEDQEQEVIEGKRPERFKGERRLLRRIDRKTKALGEERESRKGLEDQIADLKRQMEELKTSSGKTAEKPPEEPGAEPEAKPAAESAAEKPARPKRPRQADFPDWDAFEAAQEEYETKLEKYEDDLADWLRKESMREIEQQQEQSALQTEEARRNEEWNQAASRIEDYQQVVGEQGKEVPCSRAMEVAMKRMTPEDGTAMAYYLVKHPEAAKRITEATVAQSEAEWNAALVTAGIELGSLVAEAKAAIKPKAAEPPPAATPTTPKREPRKSEPITPVAARVSPSGGTGMDKPVGSDGFSLDAYAAMRRQKKG